MRAAIIRQVKAIYALFEDEIAKDEWEYTDEFKADLDRRFAYYKGGGKMVSAKDANKQFNELFDKAYIAEMDKRLKELESGKVKGLKLDDLATGARLAYKNRKRKKS